MKYTQLIAIYFPQFHNIPENDKWWGKNFTDWELVKNAKPIFQGHNQPRVPLNENYYNPCDKEVLRSQIQLAKSYNIYGFMFYHYWFDGKLILEKPLEVFLNNKDLDISFCLSWANNSWTRQWKANNEFLIEQKHLHEKKIWEKHFDYLLPFFKDKRYIKIDSKVVFVINDPALIKIKTTQEMFTHWQYLAKKNGINGIYFIASKHYDYINPSFLEYYNALLKIHPREANNSNQNKNAHKILKIKWFRLLPEKIQNIIRQIRLKYKSTTYIDSIKIWNYIIKSAYLNNYPKYKLDIFEAIYFDWDNTARYGKRATVYGALDKQEKINNLREILRKSEESNVPFIFFNAWNEWSEGTYLEPDKSKGSEDLEIIKKIFKIKNK